MPGALSVVLSDRSPWVARTSFGDIFLYQRRIPSHLQKFIIAGILYILTRLPRHFYDQTFRPCLSVHVAVTVDPLDGGRQSVMRPRWFGFTRRNRALNLVFLPYPAQHHLLYISFISFLTEDNQSE